MTTRNDTQLLETKDGVPRNNDHLLRWCEGHQTRDNCHEWLERHEELHAKFTEMYKPSAKFTVIYKPSAMGRVRYVLRRFRNRLHR